MITSKTYNGAAGFNYIEASELLFTVVYAVKREGTQYDRYISGSSNRTYIYNQSEGRIYFPLAFNEGGEKIFVIFKGTGSAVVCNPAALVFSNLPNGRVGVEYTGMIIFTGTLPFTLSGLSLPSWATADQLGTAVRITGTPDATGTDTISFNVENCGQSLPFSEDIEILPATSNLGITNTSFSGAQIAGVSGIPYTILTGSFPLVYGTGINASHGNYLGIVSVNVTSVAFPCTLSIYKNGVLQQSLSVTANGTYNFTPFTIFTANTINIVLS